MSRGRFWVIAACLLAALLVAACSGGDDDTPATPEDTVEVAEATTAAETPSPEATSTPTAEPATATPTDVPPTATPKPPTATPMPVVSDAELIALAEAIFPKVGDSIYAACDTRTDLDCPITTRLRLRVASPDVRLCRCQNASNTREIEALDERSDDGGGIVRVTMYQGNTIYDLVVVREGGDWRVDDEYCAGQPETSIYEVAGPC